MSAPPASEGLLPAWVARSPIPAAMLNPALFGVVTATAAHQYEETTGFAMPWALSFLVCPIVLHAPTRNALPRTSRTSLGKWVHDHPVLAAGFPARARHMAPHVREGLRFGLSEGMFITVKGGALHCPRLPRAVRVTGGDLRGVVLGAGMLGRVFGRTANPPTIFATLGVHP